MCGCVASGRPGVSVDGEETSEWGVDYLTVYHRGWNLIEMLKRYMIQRGTGNYHLRKLLKSVSG